MSEEIKCPHCPYYIQTTSYGTEYIRCGNDSCNFYKEDRINRHNNFMEKLNNSFMEGCYLETGITQC